MRTLSITLWSDATPAEIAEATAYVAERLRSGLAAYGRTDGFMARADGSITRTAWSHDGDRLITVGTWEAK